MATPQFYQALQELTVALDNLKVIINGLNNDFDTLKALLESDEWPKAVPTELICDESSEQDKIIRAEGIIELIISEPMENKKFLDFGCGEGHVVFKAADYNTYISVGYDIKEFVWDNKEKAFCTTSWDKVMENSPYDIILIYDVLDHAEGATQVELLKKAKSLLSKDGKIYLRCHPFTSRHATHVYREMNKAYVHLVFTEEEMEKLGLKGLPIQKVIHPLMTYSNWFKEAELMKVSETPIREIVEKFFIDNPIVSARIKANWITSHDTNLKNGKNFPAVQVEQQFVDYVLKNS